MINKIKDWFSYLSISQKLSAIVFIGLMVTIFISTLVIIFYDRNESRQYLRAESKVLSNILGVRSAAALLFLDKKTAQANLSTLFERKETLFACIYDKQDALFSSYSKDNNYECFDDLINHRDELGEVNIHVEGQIITVEPIFLKGNLIGSILISSSLEKLNQRTASIATGTFFLLVIASLISLIIINKLQKNITGPILKLAEVAKKVIKEEDYSLRGKSVFHDETEVLTNTFNKMLHHIQGVQLEMNELVEELKENSQKSKDEADEQIERNESIRHYFSGVTHDLKQPLQAIEMFSSILVTSPEDHRDVVNSKLRASVANLRQMFDDWLNVSKLEDSLKQLNKTNINIQSLMSSIVSEVSVLANDKNLKLKVHSPDYIIYSNPKMIERIIRNLLSNAIRYTENGGIILACRLCDEGYKIQVSDTGIGISEEKQSSVFEKFTQVSENKQLTGQGYGLGLSIVKKFCDTLGHDIILKSKPGLGTTFSIIIKNKKEVKKKEAPVKYDRRFSDQRKLIENEVSARKTDVKTSHNDKSDVNQSVMVNTSYNSFSKDVSILIVDDDGVILDAIVSQIKSWGVNVVGVNDLEQASIEVTENDYSLIISDFQLGEDLDGLKLLNHLEKIRLEQSKEVIPSFIITASLDGEILKQIKESKYEYMPKPLKPAKLRAKLEFIFKNS